MSFSDLNVSVRLFLACLISGHKYTQLLGMGSVRLETLLFYLAMWKCTVSVGYINYRTIKIWR